jgi:putative ABC transport system substrate-binding protein
LFHELVPKAAVIGFLLNPEYQNAETQLRDMQEAARSLGLQLHVLNANRERDFDTAFATLVQLRAGGLVIGSDVFFTSRRDQIVDLAARHAVPTIYPNREYAAAGGLISYGTNLADAYRQQGVYASRILKGEKPADLPVIQAAKFELVINLKTAKTLGIKISDNVLSIADEVIE